MYKIAMFLLALCVSLSTIAYAEPGSSYDPSDRSQNDRSQYGDTKTDTNVSNSQIIGTIQRVDLDKNSIMIREENGDTVQKYRLTDSTAYSNQSPKMTASSLKVGDRVQMVVEPESHRVLRIDKVRNDH